MKPCTHMANVLPKREETRDAMSPRREEPSDIEIDIGDICSQRDYIY